MNNLKFKISYYLAARNLRFWTDAEISATGQYAVTLLQGNALQISYRVQYTQR